MKFLHSSTREEVIQTLIPLLEDEVSNLSTEEIVSHGYPSVYSLSDSDLLETLQYALQDFDVEHDALEAELLKKAQTEHQIYLLLTKGEPDGSTVHP